MDISGFETGLVTRFNVMFSECQKLTSVDVSHFDFSSAVEADRMFKDSGVTDVGCTITVPEGCDDTEMFANSPME